MVVMARSIGIPARFVIGYYRGSYDEVNRRYIVTEADAHSWVEVYFPGVGWVPFEPTAGRSEIERLVPGLFIETDFSPNEDFSPIDSWYARISRFRWSWVIYTLSGIVMFLVIIIFVDEARLRRLSPSEAIRFLYQRLFRFGSYLRIRSRKSDTPWEFASSLQAQVVKISQRGILSEFVAAARLDIDIFTEAYTQILYSPYPVKFWSHHQIISLYRRLIRRLCVAWINSIFIREGEIVHGRENNGEEK
jgi:hypothetical protein